MFHMGGYFYPLRHIYGSRFVFVLSGFESVKLYSFTKLDRGVEIEQEHINNRR